MIHPLLRLVATQPQLLADHAEAYAGLIGEELGKTTTAWRQRVVLNAAALCLAGAAVVLGGVALMLWAVLPEASLRLPWVLLATPVVPALLALISLSQAGVTTQTRSATSSAKLPPIC